MLTKRVSVADGKRSFTQLLREAREKRIPVLIYNERRDELAGVLLPPDEYTRYARIRAYLKVRRLSEVFQHLDLNAADLARQSRRDLESRTS